MNGIRNIQSENDIRSAIRRNERAGLQKPKREMNNVPQNYSSFLEKYVFEKLGVSASLMVANLQTQYYASQNFRDRRQRNIEFVRGRHFNELVFDSELQTYVTQWRYNQRRGMPPLTYNVISKLVRSLEGQFRNGNTGNVVSCDSKDERGTEFANFLTRCLERVHEKNKLKNKDAANFKEMLVSGWPVFKTMWANDEINKKPYIKVKNVNPALFTINPGVIDYDFENLRVAFEVHNTSLNDIVGAFSNGDYEKGTLLRNMYVKYQGNENMQSSYTSQQFDGTQIRNNTFNHQGVNNSAYRYIEVWTEISDYEAITEDPLDAIPGARICHKWRDVNSVKKDVDAENEKRLEMGQGIDPAELLINFKTDFVQRFYVIYLTPWGYVLDVRESPFKNAKHPYSITPPDLNGEVWGITEEVLDAQLSMDRQIRNADAIIDNASKGVWLVPDVAIPDTHTPKEYLTELRKADGAVIYKVKPEFENHIPHQVYANSANVSNNIQEMIHLYSGLVDEITGNYGAVQGRGGNQVSKTAAGYAMETQNASLNVSGIMETFNNLQIDRDTKILQLILESYTKDDYKQVVGEELDPNEIRRHEFSVKQNKGVNSAQYKMQLETELLQLVRDQLIPFDVFVEISDNPLLIQAKQKLEEWQKKKQQSAQMPQMPEGQNNAMGNAEQPVAQESMPPMLGLIQN